jgi:hypothetical protein
MRRIILISVLITFFGQLNAQNNIFENYIQEGLESNLLLKQNQ